MGYDWAWPFLAGCGLTAAAILGVQRIFERRDPVEDALRSIRERRD